MTNNFETWGSMIMGFITTALVSNHLMEEMAMKSIIAIMTGFLGAMAGLFAKVLFNIIREKFSKKKDGVKI